MLSESITGAPECPVRVAVVGAGPAGFFVADALLRRESPCFEVDLIERLPTPFGLVRAGVAPDHQKIKSVTRTFERTAQSRRFRFLGNVEVGRDVSPAELAAHYDQVVYAMGSSTDRRLGIPGEELAGSHSGTAFVGWYNAHPDFRDFPFRLDAERAVVVGVGNVALDIARVLLRSPAELAKTDIAGHALEVLRGSRVREVVLLSRRGPAQAAFTPGELQDIAELEGVRVAVDAAAVEGDLAQAEGLAAGSRKNLESLLALARAEPRAAERTLRLRFCASPIELLGAPSQRVRAVRIEENELVRDAQGVKARGTGRVEELAAGLVFRSIGYFGVPLAGIPFDTKAGIVPNRDGRVTAAPDGDVLPATYAAGWIRRGPQGVIGTNKADGQAVAEKMVEDVPLLNSARRLEKSRAAVDALLASRRVRVATFADWTLLDSMEIASGQTRDKVREKFSRVDEMLEQIGKKASVGA
jgi:ferredoxin--NADP+ reductase